MRSLRGARLVALGVLGVLSSAIVSGPQQVACEIFGCNPEPCRYWACEFWLA